MLVISLQQLLNSGSKAMNVNGGTPKTFSYSPGGFVSVGIIGLSCLLKDEGTTSFTNFGALGALTNGIQIQWSVGGNTTNLALIKDNSDLTHTFPHDQHFGNSAVLSLLSIVTPEGFGNTNNVFRGCLKFDQPIILTGSDALNAIVQDNISGIDVFNMSAIVEQDL